VTSQINIKPYIHKQTRLADLRAAESCEMGLGEEAGIAASVTSGTLADIGDGPGGACCTKARRGDAAATTEGQKQVTSRV